MARYSAAPLLSILAPALGFARAARFALIVAPICALLSALLPAPAFAWDGMDQKTGEYVEIADRADVKRGNTIEIYFEGTEEYEEAEIKSTRDSDAGTEIDIYNHDRQKFQVLEME